MVKPSHLVIALSVVALCAIAPRASAQMSTGELRDHGYAHRVSGELGFHYREQTIGLSETEIALFQPSLYGTFGLLPTVDDGLSVEIDTAWRFGGVAGDISAFRAANPYLGVRVGVRSAEGWRARGGLGFTLPLTNLYDDYDGAGGFDAAGAVAILGIVGLQGAWDPWLESVLNAAIVLRGDFEYRHQYFAAGAETAFAALLPVEYQGRTGDTTYAAQLAVWGAGRPIPELALGVRFQAVMLDSSRDGTSPEGYLALIPFVRGEIGDAFVESRLVMNLDDPLGFAFDDGRFWAIYLLGGGTFG
jgi:hypothetical protein